MWNALFFVLFSFPFYVYLWMYKFDLDVHNLSSLIFICSMNEMTEWLNMVVARLVPIIEILLRFVYF